MARYRTSFRTRQTGETAFAYLSRFERAVEWDPGVTAGVMVTPEPVGLGSRFRLVAAFGGRAIPLEYEIVEHTPPERVVLRAETATIRSTDTITFVAEGSDTIVTYEALLEAKGFARLAEPLLALAFRRIGDRAAAGLRTGLSSVASA